MKTLKIFAIVSITLTFSTIAHADTFGVLSPFEIEFVTVGNPSNPADSTGNPNPAGKVDYTYRISKYEISEAMIDAANAEGGLGLTKDNRGANKPATSINWLEAATFINWLNTSQGHQAAYNFDTSGMFQLWSSAEAWQLGGENRFRHKDTVYFLPSMDEWYKAAYYDPTSGVYYDYPTGSDLAPTAVTSGTAPGTAVYQQAFSTGPADITQAGGLSPYGTMGQSGNAREWEETEFDLVNDASSPVRGLRSASWSFGLQELSSTWGRGGGLSSTPVGLDIGFRVASVVPEPSSGLLGMLTAAGLMLRRRRSS